MDKVTNKTVSTNHDLFEEKGEPKRYRTEVLPLTSLTPSARLLPQSYQYPNLSEGADRVGGQLRGDKECPFSGVTKCGRVWRKVPESDARSVGFSCPGPKLCPASHLSLSCLCELDHLPFFLVNQSLPLYIPLVVVVFFFYCFFVLFV